MKKLLKPTSYPKALVYSISLNAFAKGLVFLVNLLIAFYFGATAGTDVYFFCYTAIFLFINLTSNMNSSVIIPEAMMREGRNGRASFEGFLNRYSLSLLSLLAVIALIVYSDPIFIFSKISQFSITTLEENRLLIILSVPALICQCISFYLNDVLTSRRYFTLPMLISAINGLVVILFVVLGHDRFGIPSIMWGNILGFSLGIGIQLFILLKLVHWKFILTGETFGKQVWRNLTFTNMGYLATIASAFLPMYLLSDYAGGYITTLSLGLRIAEVPNTMIATQLASVVGIRFSESYARGQLSNINEIFLKSGRLLCFLLIPVSVLVYTFSNEIAYLFFGYGGFDEVSRSHISQFLEILIIACPFIGINVLVARLLMATQKIRVSFYYQIAFNVALALLTIVLIRTFGPVGYTYAYVALYAINFVVLAIFLRQITEFIQYGKLFPYAVMIGIVNLLIMIAVLGINQLVETELVYIRLLLAGSVYGALLFMANWMLRLNNDIYEFLGDLRKKFN